MSSTAPESTAPELAQRLTLDAAGAGCWRNLHGDANQNGRSYGGQLLGQAMQAALLEAPAGRAPTMMQFLFLQGAMPESPIVFRTERLQEGKRFTSLHVRGTQGPRTVLDAQVSCAVPMGGPSHARPTTAPAGEQPGDLADLADTPAVLRDRIALMGGYGRDCNAAIEFRIPEARTQLAGPAAEFRYWMRVPSPLPDNARLHACAFAYLSDWWLNFCILSPHLHRAGEQAMYISSLNHSLWFHRQPRADEWIHVHARATHAAQGHGLAVADYHDQQGRHLATAAQDCLIAYVD